MIHFIIVLLKCCTAPQILSIIICNEQSLLRNFIITFHSQFLTNCTFIAVIHNYLCIRWVRFITVHIYLKFLFLFISKHCILILIVHIGIWINPIDLWALLFLFNNLSVLVYTVPPLIYIFLYSSKDSLQVAKTFLFLIPVWYWEFYIYFQVPLVVFVLNRS